MKNIAEKFGSLGAVFAAAACPICFPKLALFGALFGLGALAPYETAFFFASQTLVIVAVVAHVISYKKHENKWLLSLSLICGAAFFVSLYVVVSEYLSYAALAGLVGATLWQLFWNRRCTSSQ